MALRARAVVRARGGRWGEGHEAVGARGAVVEGGQVIVPPGECIAGRAANGGCEGDAAVPVPGGGGAGLWFVVLLLRGFVGLYGGGGDALAWTRSRSWLRTGVGW